MEGATSTWTALPGAQLPTSNVFIGGGIVKRLSLGVCDMMYADTTFTQLRTCSGNYNWTTTAMNPGTQSGEVQFVPVGINYFKNLV